MFSVSPDAIYSLKFSLLNSFSEGGGFNTTENRAAAIIQVLKQKLPLPEWTKTEREPFETLVVTILSQNTADTNTVRAFESLTENFGITPQALFHASVSQIEKAIKIAGLYHSKARTIKQAATEVLKKYHGSLQPILSQPLEKARQMLMQFPGVGPKTADVVLLFSAMQPTIPVDTHVNRVSKRLGFAPENGDYEKVRGSLQKLFNPADYLAVHLLFIAHGRKTCKARYPLCKQCLIKEYCPSNGKWGK